MTEQKINIAITTIENHRKQLGNDVSDTTLSALRKQLAILQSKQSNRQQRKLISILFVDVVSSTKTFEKLDPEDVLTIMDETLRIFGKTVESNGGMVARLFGDALLAFFGAPVSGEDDAERAIRAGLGIIADAKRQGEIITSQYDVKSFNVRVGINTGLVALGEVGGAGMEYTAMGDAINVASHLESAAPAGHLLISHDTYRHVRGLFDVELAEKMQFKGRQELTQTYIVHMAKPRGFRAIDHTVEGVETRMIGRGKQLADLKDIYGKAIENRHIQWTTIFGEGGMGKTRLLHEFDIWVEEQDEVVRYFETFASKQTQHVPYSMFHNLFMLLFEIDDNDSTDSMRQKFRDGIGELIDPSKADVIGELIGFDFADSPEVLHLQGEGSPIHDAGFHFMKEYFDAACHQAVLKNKDQAPMKDAIQPTVIYFEDIQWADGSSLELIQFLVDELTDTPLLLICLARPELFKKAPHWGKDYPAHKLIELTSLSNADSEALAREILQKVEKPPKKLIQLIVKNANGSPFYIEELIKMLIDEGVITVSEEWWWVEASELKNVAIPPTLTGLVQARLDKLPAAERELIKRASVIGQTFWDDAIKHLQAGDEVKIGVPPEFLEDLIAREIVVHHTDTIFNAAQEYAFSSAILRDVAYESVLRSERNKYHIMAANWLEEHSKERRREYVGMISEHYILAGEHQNAVKYLKEAAVLAAHVGDYRDSIRDLERAMSLLNEAKDIIEFSEMTRDCGIYYQELGELKNAQEAYEKSLDYFAKANDDAHRAEVMSKLGGVLLGRGEFVDAKVMLEAALELADASGNEMKRPHILKKLGNLAKQNNELKSSLAYLQKSYDDFEMFGDQLQMARVLRKMGIVARLQGDYDGAMDYMQRSLEISVVLDDSWGQAAILNGLGENARFQNKFEEAKAYYLQGYEAAEAIGNRQLLAVLNLNLGHIYRFEGDAELAMNHYCYALKEARTMGAVPIKLHAVISIAGVEALKGNQKRAVELLSLGMNHAAYNSRSKHTAEPIYAEFKANIPHEIFEPAFEHGKDLVLRDTVKGILQDFGFDLTDY